MPGVLSKWRSASRSSSPMPQENMFRRSDKSGARSHYSNGYGSDHHSESEDSPTYLLEHLATFSVGPQFGMVAPRDGLERLLLMEKTSGIWTQKMQMRLEKNWMVIIDYENGNVVERFPMKLISEPTAYDDTLELYKNIFIFIVKEDHKSHTPSEMHIFQCAQISAQELVDDLKLYMSGKPPRPRAAHHARHLPPPPNKPPPEPPGVNVRDQVQAFNQAAASHHLYGGPRAAHSRGGGECDDSSSVGSNCYELEVSVLNKCFDDIENFILRLHNAAAAHKELEKKKKSKKHAQDKNLLYRAQAPSEKDFYDILQKFKLCFNLLAKLKNHIHDPNAAELVHFIFTLLALVVDAARDSGCNPQQVAVPLLTRPAVRLLEHCCTSKETDLWHSLGNYWIVPRSEFKDVVDNYKPVFANGFVIPPGFSDESSVVEPPPHEDHYHSKAELYEERRVSPDYGGGRPAPDARSDFSADSIEHDFEAQQQHWLEELLSRRAKAVQVVYHRHANNEKELTVIKGEILEILDDSRNWWKARNQLGQVGHVPNTIVVPYEEIDYGHSSVYAPRESEHARDSPIAKDRYSDNGSGSPSHLGDSRRPPIPPPAPAEWVRRERQGKNGARIRYFRHCYYCNQRRAGSPTSPAPARRLRGGQQTISLDLHSSSLAVSHWLKSRGFGDKVMKELRGMPGSRLLELRREELVELLGRVEGGRLYVLLKDHRHPAETKKFAEEAVL